jgi:hypothetical protein
MHASLVIARMMGPLLSVIGIGMLANNAVYGEMARQFIGAYPFIYFSGILILLGGLAILNSNPHWTRDWRSLITLLGWAMCIGGSFRIIAPHLVAFIGTRMLAQPGFLIGVGIFLLSFGAFLTFKGYAA